MFTSYWFYEVHTVSKDSWLKKSNVRILDLENTYISCRIDVTSFILLYLSFRYIVHDFDVQLFPSMAA